MSTFQTPGRPASLYSSRGAPEDYTDEVRRSTPASLDLSAYAGGDIVLVTSGARPLLPAAMRALHGHDLWAENVPAFWSWAAHLVFGLALACYPWVRAHLIPVGAVAGTPAEGR